MKIVRLLAENIKRLKVVEITPTGDPVVTIGGKNKQGKTSVLDSIQYALGGKEGIPDQPVRRGAKNAKVVLDLGDLIVTRTFTSAGGGSLSVTNKADGSARPSPQAVLDRLMGKIAFDPLAFTDMKADAQGDLLRRLVGLDVSDLDKLSVVAYEERATVNRDVKRLEGQLAGLPHHKDAPAEEVSIDALTNEVEAAALARTRAAEAALASRSANSDLDAKGQALRAFTAECERLDAEIARLDAARGAAAAGAVRTTAEVKALMVAADKALAAAQDASAAVPDTDAINAKLRSASTTNDQVRANARRKEVADDLEAKRAASTKLSRELESLAEAREARLRDAAFPVPGLGIDAEGKVTFDGLPFDQASGAEQLRVSVAIGIALNPELKVLLVRDGSLLDSDGLRLLAEQAAEADAQVWLEKVAESKDGGVSVFIEEGEVVP